MSQTVKEFTDDDIRQLDKLIVAFFFIFGFAASLAAAVGTGKIIALPIGMFGFTYFACAFWWLTRED